MAKIKWVRVELGGLNLSNILKKIADANIVIKNLKKKDNRCISFRIGFFDYQKMMDLLEIIEFNLKIKETKTIFIYFRKFVWISGVMLGIILSFSWFISTSSFVSCVHIIGGDSSHICENGNKCIFFGENKQELEEYINSLGVRNGEKLSSLNKSNIERAILAKYKSVSSCVVEIKGVEVFVSIHEGTLENSDKLAPSMNIVAPENGIVKTITVSRGKQKVKSGEVVKKGQILIQGTEGVSAIGSVEMSLFFVSSKVHAENKVELVRTGNFFETSAIDVFGLTILKDKNPKHGFTYFEVEKIDTFTSPNLFLPIKNVRYRYYELHEENVFYSIESQKRSIENALIDEIIKREGMGNQEPTRATTVVTKLADNVYEVTCYVEVNRIIKQ